ncbi:YkgJ family cysteine cluster protein [uncultured Oscillibacter sp.]|uniref:YkgJ family cysteine cluster protein n=1 Tax=uncultured Oscillibacter sp. TaxID=876091 RepID=UPI0025DC354E|nr:YkgJ family cysteine cluster protein [uncultured Oscillibacter sp.]
MFPCDKCGECCRNLQMSELYKELDRGDGTCRYLNGNLCSIYQTRPLLCRIDESYDRFFSGSMTREAFYRANLQVCSELKKKNRRT